MQDPYIFVQPLVCWVHDASTWNHPRAEWRSHFGTGGRVHLPTIASRVTEISWYPLLKSQRSLAVTFSRRLLRRPGPGAPEREPEDAGLPEQGGVEVGSMFIRALVVNGRR